MEFQGLVKHEDHLWKHEEIDRHVFYLLFSWVFKVKLSRKRPRHLGIQQHQTPFRFLHLFEEPLAKIKDIVGSRKLPEASHTGSLYWGEGESVHGLHARGLWKAFLGHSFPQRPRQGIRMSLAWIINFKCGRFEFWEVSHVSVFNSSSCLMSPLHQVWYHHFKAMLLVGILPQQGLIVWLNLFFYLPTLFKTFLHSQIIISIIIMHHHQSTTLWASRRIKREIILRLSNVRYISFVLILKASELSMNCNIQSTPVNSNPL